MDAVGTKRRRIESDTVEGFLPAVRTPAVDDVSVASNDSSCCQRHIFMPHVGVLIQTPLW